MRLLSRLKVLVTSVEMDLVDAESVNDVAGIVQLQWSAV